MTTTEATAGNGATGPRDEGPVAHVNLAEAELIERSLRREEGVLAANGALVARTGEHTGRSPDDRFIVAEGEVKQRVDWGGFNRPIEREDFDPIAARARQHLEGRERFVVDGYVGADPEHRIHVRVTTELAWHALFARQLFRRPSLEELETFEPEFQLLVAATLELDPDRDATDSSTFIGVDLEGRQVVICGTRYAGEMKKSIFGAANYLFPTSGTLSMHCSANVGEDDHVALFFGLSGTGKTTLSADPQRRLIGDDEHGWSDSGVFNLEGGCYAKTIDLSAEQEPHIWQAIRFGSVLENVVLDERTRNPDYEDDSLTQNTRGVYPLEFIPNHVPEGRAGHAGTVIFLTADAFGVLPPVSLLDRHATMYHFLSGFTSKLAGTEVGLGDEPEATFSACFGAPFLPLAPGTYAEMLAERIDRHEARVFLVNTGWSGGAFGDGERMDLETTRALVAAATSGGLADVKTRRHPIFNVEVPVSCPGVEDEILDPRATWSDGESYDEKARELAAMFAENFEQFADQVSSEVAQAGPHPK